MTAKNRVRTTPNSSPTSETETAQVQGDTKVRMTHMIVAGSLLALLMIILAIFLCKNPDLAKSHGAAFVQALLYLGFALLGAFGIAKTYRSN